VANEQTEAEKAAQYLEDQTGDANRGSHMTAKAIYESAAEIIRALGRIEAAIAAPNRPRFELQPLVFDFAKSAGRGLCVHARREKRTAGDFCSDCGRQM